MSLQVREPTDLEFALWERHGTLGWGFVGPLTLGQNESQEAYERSCEESEREHKAEMAAGGRTVCLRCGERSVVHTSVCTLGHPGLPGAEYSGYAVCERCDYKDLA